VQVGYSTDSNVTLLTRRRLINLALPPPGIRFKQSAMPFVQMENISHFLRACESAPFLMPAHDRFLTVDLYEHKDPAQVLQCLSAFSRVANATSPAKFPTTIGPKKTNPMSPTMTGPGARNGATSPYVTSARPMSPVKTGGSTTSSTADGLRSAPTSSWSRKGDQGTTSPAWNIAQYGYMGGASQGNQGVAFGARRQITSASPHVPNSGEKERMRREKEDEEARLKLQAEEAEQKRQVEREAEEELQRVEEERRWADETKRLREEERSRLAEQKRQWEEEERRWKMEEEARQKEDAGIMQQSKLKGQYLNQYQAEQPPTEVDSDTPEQRRVRELEKQLEEARERERQYQLEREGRMRQVNNRPQQETPQPEPERPSSSKESEASWAPDEREYLRQAAPTRTTGMAGVGSARPLPDPSSKKPTTAQPAAETRAPPSMPSREMAIPAPSETRSQPEPEEYRPQTQAASRTDRFLSSNPAPIQSKPRISQPAEMGLTTSMEQQADADRRVASQQKTKAGGWASKSLLEREMERERERQKEWEANQEATKNATRDVSHGSGPGQSWDVHQYGYAGGDSQNKGSSSGSGISFGGRRQIIGPRPQPNK